MVLNELYQNQKLQLKQSILTEKLDNVSYDELANADTLISDTELEEYFGTTFFVEEDFFTE